jgi:hypothetical protein
MLFHAPPRGDGPSITAPRTFFDLILGLSATMRMHIWRMLHNRDHFAAEADMDEKAEHVNNRTWAQFTN